MRVVTLGNGLRIGNFSSPHPFKFNTGEVLDGVPPETSRELSLNRVETEVKGADSRYTDIRLEFQMNQVVGNALSDAAASDVDIIIVPLPVKTALEAIGHWDSDLFGRKLRTCILSDRVNKTIHSDKYGV
jgi:hypothetical protein